MRQAQKRALRNKSVRSEVKTYIKKFEAALESNDLETARQLFSLVQKKLDKAVSKGVYHKNYASRKKSRLAAKLASLTEAQ